MTNAKCTTKIAAMLAVAMMLASTPLRAEEGRIHITFIKTRSGVSGSGNLFFDGHRYRIDLGGIGAEALPLDRVDLVGAAANLHSAADIVGTYSVAEANPAAAARTRSLDLKSGRGTIVELHAVDLKNAALDLGGLTITAHGWGAQP